METAIWKFAMPPDIQAWFESPGAMRTRASAIARTEILRDGIVSTTVTHDTIHEVTPAMLEWWYSRFANISLLTSAGTAFSAFRLWHPRDHIGATIKEHSLSGQFGFSRGAHVQMHERWGCSRRRIRAYVRQMNRSGLRLDYCWGPFTVAQLAETFERVADGTAYTSTLVADSRFELVSKTLNGLLPPSTCMLIDSWIEHSIEEIGNFERFLPQLFARGSGH